MLNKVKVEIIKLKTSKQIDKIWIAGHNVIASDMLVLYAQCKREKIVFGDYLRSLGVEGIIDTLKIARLLPGSSEGVGLGYLYKKYTGSEFADAHDALADAKATAKLLSKLLQIKDAAVDVYSLDSVVEHLEHLEQEHASIIGASTPSVTQTLVAQDIVGFGKYKGKPVAEILKDEKYCTWLKELITADQKMIALQECVTNLRKDKENMPNQSSISSAPARPKTTCRCKVEIGKPCPCMPSKQRDALGSQEKHHTPANPSGERASSSASSCARRSSNQSVPSSSVTSSAPSSDDELLCVECKEEPASVKCAQCRNLCGVCSDQLHQLKTRKDHVLEPINQPADKRDAKGEPLSDDSSSESERGGDSDQNEDDAEDRWSDSGSDGDEPGGDAAWEDCSTEMTSIDGPSKEWKLPLREEYSPLVPGAVGIDSKLSITDIFLQLLDGKAFLKLALTFTNAYARVKKRTNWHEVKEDEMWAFVGLVLFFGRMQLSRADAWRPHPVGNPYVKSVMSFRRFSDIFACFHLVDTGKVSTEAKKKNAFWQMQPLIDIVNRTWPVAYNAGREISIDEATTPEEGRCRAKNYNKDKPHKWGLKDFMLCCARTGYCFRVHPYQGKDEKRPVGQSLAEYAVKAVMLSKFYRAGYILAVDNWFMCWAVVEYCMENGIDLIGTVRKGRKGFPTASQYTLDSNERGACKALRRIHGRHVAYMYVWNDNKPVRVMSTFLTPIGRVQRKIKANKGVPFANAQIPQPCAIAIYNNTKGGVDLGDQSTEYVRPVIRSRRNMRNYFMCKLTRNANNARIIKGAMTERKIPMNQAILEIAQALIHPFLQR